MLEEVTKLITNELHKSIMPAVSAVKSNILVFAIKVVVLCLSLIALVGGLVLLGSKYIGLDVMMIVTGVVLLVTFLLLK
ncbi:hypothetical protein HY489_01655 [Candidatus Woesearchaeota archaeon]|nr:hypothetical protein [Candidatus Woesearchaeota archaeon]